MDIFRYCVLTDCYGGCF